MGSNSVPKFIFRLSRFPVYRGSVLGRFYCTTIELKNISNTSDNTDTLLIQDTPRQMPVLSDEVILLSSTSVLNPNGQFLDCATFAFGERYEQAASQKGL